MNIINTTKWKFHNFNLFSFVIFLSIFSLVACSKEKPPTQNNEPDKIEYSINFSHTFNNKEILFDSLLYTDAAGNKMDVQKLIYFLSKITLIAEDNKETELANIVYIDAKDPTTLRFSSSKAISKTKYKSLRLTFGLDQELNISGRFKDFPELSMEWPEPMGGGYHYMMFEGSYETDSVTNTYAIHLGRLDKNENFFTVEAPIDWTLSNKSFNLNINMNLEEWFKNPNNIDLNSMPHMIMMDQDAQVLFKENGEKVFSFKID